MLSKYAPGDRRASRLRRLCWKGFTLIELLVVVAIISILASIAVPNFLEAQVRAKSARVKSDMRTITVGLESYQVDWNAYPPRTPDDGFFVPRFDKQMEDMSILTTPVAFLGSLPVDIFAQKREPSGGDPFIGTRPAYLIDYFDPEITTLYVRQAQGGRRATYSGGNYMLMSVGPDGYIGLLSNGQPGNYPKQPAFVRNTWPLVYDPSNGSVSKGNIFRFQGQQDPARLLTRIRIQF